MSTQNQSALNYGTGDNLVVETSEITEDYVQRAIIQKITNIRKINLRIGFSEAALATQLDKKREWSKQLYSLEWHYTVDNNEALRIVEDMEKKNQMIDELFDKIQALRIELAREEKELSSYLSYQ